MIKRENRTLYSSQQRAEGSFSNTHVRLFERFPHAIFFYQQADGVEKEISQIKSLLIQRSFICNNSSSIKVYFIPVRHRIESFPETIFISRAFLSADIVILLLFLSEWKIL